jgi:hypothetical protein
MDRAQPVHQGEIDRLNSGHGSPFAIFRSVSSLAIYIIGFVILVAGLAYAASLAGVSTEWIAAGVLVLVGLGIATGVTRTRQRDPSHQ